jgi:cytochrome c-type biogenesis protein CcmH/NrfF
MIPLLTIVLGVLLWNLVRRHRAQERKRDLLVMKRHVARYGEQVKHRLAG